MAKSLMARQLAIALVGDLRSWSRARSQPSPTVDGRWSSQVPRFNASLMTSSGSTPSPAITDRMRADTRPRAADWPRDLPTWPLLGLICLASALTLVILGTRLTFFNDDWYLLLQRPGVTADSLLTPLNGHFVGLLLLAYKSLVALFGLGSQVPFRLVLAVAVESVGIFVYLLVRERAGRLLGLLAAAIVVFLGPAWEGLLWFGCLDLIG
jgi:hypothetical protein